MNELIRFIGLDDGEGNTSSMRVIVFLVVFTILLPRAWIGFKTLTVPALSEQDMILIGMALGAKLYQNHQENGSSPTKKDQQAQ